MSIGVREGRGDQERLDAIVKLVCLLVLDREGGDLERLDAIVK